MIKGICKNLRAANKKPPFCPVKFIYFCKKAVFTLRTKIDPSG